MTNVKLVACFGLRLNATDLMDPSFVPISSVGCKRMEGTLQNVTLG